MSCELFRRFALDQNWDSATRRRAVQTLQHLDSCAECQQAIGDYDRLRQTLGTFATQVDPPVGWDDIAKYPQSAPPRPARATGRTPTSRYPSRWRIAWTAIAASIFVAASVAFELGQAIARPVSLERPIGLIGADHAFSPKEVQRELDDFAELSRSSNRPVAWMVATNSMSNMGFADDAQPLTRRLLLLRLKLTHGPEVTSSADLLIIPGQSANFTISASRGPALHYRVRTSAEDPARISVSLEMVRPQIADPVAALATNLRLIAGEKLTAGRLVTADGEYELNLSFAYDDHR